MELRFSPKGRIGESNKETFQGFFDLSKVRGSISSYSGTPSKTHICVFRSLRFNKNWKFSSIEFVCPILPFYIELRRIFSDFVIFRIFVYDINPLATLYFFSNPKINDIFFTTGCFYKENKSRYGVAVFNKRKNRKK